MMAMLGTQGPDFAFVTFQQEAGIDRQFATSQMAVMALRWAKKLPKSNWHSSTKHRHGRGCLTPVSVEAERTSRFLSDPAGAGATRCCRALTAPGIAVQVSAGDRDYTAQPGVGYVVALHYQTNDGIFQHLVESGFEPVLSDQQSSPAFPLFMYN
jgi:hypothetical protein